MAAAEKTEGVAMAWRCAAASAGKMAKRRVKAVGAALLPARTARISRRLGSEYRWKMKEERMKNIIERRAKEGGMAASAASRRATVSEAEKMV